jgi:glycosyltransferase involved in cell wall biosynthesis
MNIAVNTRLLIKNKLEGIGWFTYETLKRITRLHPEHQFYFIFDRKYDESFVFSGNITPLIVSPQARHPVLFYLWFEMAIPGILRKINAGLFLSTDGYLSLSTPVKSFVVMHDLNFEHYPGDLPLLARKHYRYYFPRYAAKAERIATVSEFSKQDIINQYGVKPEKIDVVYNGASEEFRPLPEQEKEKTRMQFTGGLPFFVFVGALHPRKNLVNLFRAFDQFCDLNKNEYRLLIVGEKMWWTTEIKTAYERMKHLDKVVFSGRLGFGELTRVVGSALAMTYVSYFEGFGIPVVEAFYAETPVIASDVTAIPEVAGDAALPVDPFSVNSICEAMVRISQDEALRNELVRRGRERKSLFTWDKSAGRLWSSVEKIL